MRAVPMKTRTLPARRFQQTATEREAAAAVIRSRVKAGMDRQAAKSALRTAAAVGKSAAGPRGRNKDGPHGDRARARNEAKAGVDAWG